MEITRQTAVASYVVVPLIDAASRPSYKASPTLAAGDVKVIRHTGGVWNYSNIGTLPAIIGGSVTKQVLVTLTAAELTSDNLDYPIIVQFVDQTATKEWDDQEIIIWTKAVPVNATQILGTAISTPATAGILDVNIKNIADAVVNTANAQVGVNCVSSANYDFGALKKASLNAATPASVVGSVGSVAANGITATSIATDAINAASVKADAVTKIQAGLATPTNITAGVITTVTNLTNAPTVGDLTAAMKASIGTQVWTTSTPRTVTSLSGLIVNSINCYPEGFIYFDSAAANTNTVLGVDGTPSNPVSTPAAAKTLADALGTKSILIKGTWTNAVTMTGYYFKGSGHTSVLDYNGTTMTGCYFETIDLRGINLGATNIYYKVTTLNTFTIAGVIFDSEIGNTVSITGYSNIWNCQPTNTGMITLVFGASAQAVNIDNLFTTNVHISSMANAGSTIDVLFTGNPDVIIDASCTAGTINLMGFIKSLTNNSTGTTVVNDRRNTIGGVIDSNLVSIAGQTASAAAGVTFPSSIASPTNITAGTITNVTNDVGITQAGADKVWSTTVRTLSSFGTLIADIWGYVTRTLTSLTGITVDSNITKVDGVALSTHASGMLPSDVRDIVGSAVSTSTAQIGVNVVSQDNIDFGALQKASLNAATPASVVGSVGSVAGNVDGNVTGSVGSLAAQAQTDVKSAMTSQGYTTTRAGYLDNLNGIVANIWAAATSGMSTVGSIGKKLADWVLGTDSKVLISTNAQDLSTTLKVDAKVVEDKAGYSISGTKQTLDALNDISTSQVNTEVDTALSDIKLDHLIAVAESGDVVNSSIIAKIASKSVTPAFSSYNNTTDSLEALADKTGGLTAQETRDAMKLDASAGAPASGSIDKHLDDIQTATDKLNFTGTDVKATLDGEQVVVATNNDKTGYSISGTKQTLDSLNDVSTSQVNTEVDTALADIDLDHLSKVGTAPTPTVGSNLDKVMNKNGSQTFSQLTDSLEGISDAMSTSGLTQQQVRDSMKLAPTTGAPATGSIDEHLDNINTNTDLIPTYQTALLTAIESIQNNTTFVGVVPVPIMKPETGSKNYDIYVRLFDESGSPEDPDSNVMNLTIKDEAGTIIIPSSSMTRTGVGQYKYVYVVQSTDSLKILNVFFDYTENSVAFNQVRTTEVVSWEQSVILNNILEGVEAIVAKLPADTIADESLLEAAIDGIITILTSSGVSLNNSAKEYIRDLILSRNVLTRHPNAKPKTYEAGTGPNLTNVRTTINGSGDIDTEAII